MLPTRSDTNRPLLLKKMARSLKFRTKEEEELYYPCGENKGANQFRGYRQASLRLCFRLGKNPYPLEQYTVTSVSMAASIICGKSI